MPAVSVFTPSHDTTYLEDAYRSLRAQTWIDWEWIVALNGDAEWPAPLDKRVRVLPAPPALDGSVGGLKQWACAQATGDYLVELDHDDMLATTCLEEVYDAFEAHPDASLVYSHTAQINADGSRNNDIFDGDLSWRFYDDKVAAASTIYDVQACVSRPPTPHNVSYVWYAPNHVRAFRREVYEDVGGYGNLDICDDIELMCRLYQAGIFVQIPRCLYLQRIHPGNTQRDPIKNAVIQQETVRIYDKEIQANALAWANREDLRALDLGGAHNCPEGYEPVDKALGHGHILDYLARLANDSVGVVRAVDFLEHVRESMLLMNELYRVLAPGGMLLSLTPSTDGRGAFCDPTHVSFWNELSFRYYCEPEYQKYVPMITARFKQSRLVTYFPDEWHRANDVPYVCFNGTKELE